MNSYVAKWLATYPNIELMSRDGSLQSRCGNHTSTANAIQVSDRFHVVKNISKHSKDGFKRELPASFQIEEADDQGIESDCCVHFECHEAHLQVKELYVIY